MITLKNKLRKYKSQIYFNIHKISIRFGFFVTPVHYYVPIANVLELEKNKSIWNIKSELPGIDLNIQKQIDNLKQITTPFQQEYVGNHIFKEAVTFITGYKFSENDRSSIGYGYIEAQALHSFIRFYKIKKIIEVGCGVSSYCSQKALEINERQNRTPYEMICIEPFPSIALRTLKTIKLIQKSVQSVPIDIFRGLNKGDLLFIDSSHTIKPMGDVSYLINEVLPYLNSGVIVHFHDIYFPYDFQRDLLETYNQHMESSLLRAFLINNRKANVIFCMSQLHYEKSNELKEIFPEYLPEENDGGLRKNLGHFPSSIYIEIC
jgi:hypothetical protein